MDKRWPASSWVLRSHFGSSPFGSSHLAQGNPIKTRFESGFVCCVHRMVPVACLPIIKCGKSDCTGSRPLSVVEYGYTVGRKPATCRSCGKTSPRPNVTLSDFFPAKSERKKRNRSRNSSPGMSRRSRNTSPAMSRKSSVVSWSDSPREHSEANGEDTVMEDCTESHQAEINRKIKANDKLRKILTNRPEEHRTLMYGDSLKAKMQSLDYEKVSLLAAKRQFLPLQSRIETQKNYLERISSWSEYPGRLRRNNNTVWKSCKNGSRLTRNWMQHTPNRSKPSMKCRFWWPNRPQKMRRLSIRALQESSHSHQFPTQTETHNRPSSQCSNVFSRCKAWGASALLNSSWQLVRQMRKSRKSARSWHKQCGNWKVEVLSQKKGSKFSNLRVMWWYWRQSSLRAYLDSAAWTSKAKKPSRGVCRTQPQKRDVWQRSASKRKMSYNLLCLWYWIRFIAVPFYLTLSRVGEAENPGPVCATAKLFGAKDDAIVQRAQNLSSKSEVELEPLFAQVGGCRQLFSERFGKDSKPYTSSVSQDIHSTHCHLDRSSLLAVPVRVGDPVYTQQFCDYLSLFQEGEQSGRGPHVFSNLHFRGMEGKERSNPVIARPEKDANALGRNAMQRDFLE